MRPPLFQGDSQKLFTGMVALVTGGASGIGKAACMAYAREAASVCVVDRDLDMANETVAELTASGARAVAIAADVSSEQQVNAMVEQAIKAFGRIDCCFNNAGIGTVGTNSRGKSLADIDLADWQRMLAVNLTGVFLCMKYQLPALQERGGAIVNTASIAGLTALAGAAAYVASKHGVVALTKSAAIEYGQKGVRVNAVCPGHIDTPLLGIPDPQQEQLLLKRNPMNRYGTPEEVAELVIWLSSGRASFINGAAFTADGGRLAGG